MKKIILVFCLTVFSFFVTAPAGFASTSGGVEHIDETIHSLELQFPDALVDISVSPDEIIHVTLNKNIDDIADPEHILLSPHVILEEACLSCLPIAEMVRQAGIVFDYVFARTSNPFTLGPVEKTNEIRIETSDDEVLGLQGLTAGLSTEPEFDTRVEIQIQGNGHPAEAQGLVGGKSLYQCSAAFVVTDGYSVGISSAAHCLTMSPYDFQTIFDPAAVVTGDTNLGDVAWAPIEYATATNSLQTGGVTALLTITNAAAPVLGQSLNYSGYNSTVRTGVVSYKNLFAAYEMVNDIGVKYMVPVKGLWAFSSMNSLPGDSGGPVFSGSTAKGILFGAVYWNGAPRTAFSSVTALSSAGVWVYTGGPGPIIQ